MIQLEVVIFPVGSFHLIRNVAVTSALQCCFHTLFGSCRPTTADRGTLKPHEPSWDLYSAVMHTEGTSLYGASSGMLLLKHCTNIHRTLWRTTNVWPCSKLSDIAHSLLLTCSFSAGWEAEEAALLSQLGLCVCLAHGLFCL